MPIFITLNKIIQFNMQIGNIRCFDRCFELKSINKQHDTFMKNTFDIEFIHKMSALSTVGIHSVNIYVTAPNC